LLHYLVQQICENQLYKQMGKRSNGKLLKYLTKMLNMS